jgi:serine protease
MHQPAKLAAAALMASALAACSMHGSSMPAIPQTPTIPQNGASQITQSMASRYMLNGVHIMLTRNAVSSFAPNLTGLLPYNGGPVQVHPSIYVVYWGFTTDPKGEKTYLHRFLSGLGGSTWLATVKQYYQNPGPIHVTNPLGQLKGEWSDNTVVPSHPTDAQIKVEAAKLVAHFSYKASASYVVATPTKHNSSGFGTQYCAYHGAFNSGSGPVAYTNLPYMTDAGANCGENSVNPGTSGILDGVSIVEGHELAETQTDPQPPSGWSGNSGEIGDICAWIGLANTSLTTGVFATQPLYSDKAKGCVQHTP